jgi:hypothetical protein
MRRKSTGLLISSCVAIFLSTGCSTEKPASSSSSAQRVLSWLPADTETLLVANGPFWMSNFQVGGDDYQNHLIPSEELEKDFQSSTLGLFNFKNYILEKHLAGKKVLLAVEGSRHFRPTTGLGELPYEGCAIAIFADDLGDRRDAFMKEATPIALRTEDVEEQKIVVLQEQLESDVWTIFVVFPQKNVVLAATNRDFLLEVLTRMRGARGERAFPESLPEWKYVNKQAQFWGLRHFDRRQAEEDPTSPFGGRKSANIPDEQAIGLTYQCDANRKAILTYLSRERATIGEIEAHRFPSSSAPDDTAGLHIQYHEPEPGVIQSTYDLDHSRPVLWFFFVFMANLGHAIYV